ncbi:MAG: cytochrome b/b6 domain-containing protein [Asgard group archaeon]|nr:cytochrome b/b6 domain-containing protein [Asgard group archaeon]
MMNKKTLIHRIISWLLVPFAAATIITGYVMTHGWFDNYYRVSSIHRVFEWIFIPLLLIHVIYTQIFVRANWKRMISNVQRGKATSFYLLKIAARITSWLIILFSFLVILSGLNGYLWYAETIGKVIPFDWHRRIDFLLTILIIIHVVIGLKFVFIRNQVKNKAVNNGTVIASLALIAIVIFAQIPKNPIVIPPPGGENPGILATAKVNGVNYDFNTSFIQTTRPDIFVEGSFSLFDILAYLSGQGQIDMTYHFDPLMNTQVIDTINNEEFWWYRAYYSGGWPESNAFRMDHYPWKIGTVFEVFQSTEGFLDMIYETFQVDTQRKEQNNGIVIIPTVSIRFSDGTTQYFQEVEVTAHNMRPDLFINGTITGIDVIMSLGDQGKLTYSLAWYDEISTAYYVRNYWIESINDDVAHGTCGFVYENGASNMSGYNHIHIPSDARVLNSPEYAKWFWICL